MKTVIFVHGFGKMKDARGMFTDIADSLSESGTQCVLIDLNTKDKDGNILLSSLNEQVHTLTKSYSENVSSDTYLIAHSQGCIVSALANLPKIKKTIFLTPQVDDDTNKIITYFKKNPLTTINLSGISRLARRDGTFTLVPKEYWVEREQIDVATTYKTYSTHHRIVVVKALQDEVISNYSFADIFGDAETIEMEANHDFTDSARKELVLLCSKLITSL